MGIISLSIQGLTIQTTRSREERTDTLEHKQAPGLPCYRKYKVAANDQARTILRDGRSLWLPLHALLLALCEALVDERQDTCVRGRGGRLGGWREEAERKGRTSARDSRAHERI